MTTEMADRMAMAKRAAARLNKELAQNAPALSAALSAPEMTAPTMQATETHREFRAYTASRVWLTKLSPAQVRLLEQAGHGGIIRATGGVSWTSLRSMADKGAVEIVEREVTHLPNGRTINGRILAVR